MRLDLDNDALEDVGGVDLVFDRWEPQSGDAEVLVHAAPLPKMASWPAIIQRNADFGPYKRAGEDGAKIESMTVERKITSRHGVDSRPKRSSRGYPADRTALRAVIEIIALPADSTAVTLVPRARS